MSVMFFISMSNPKKESWKSSTSWHDKIDPNIILNSQRILSLGCLHRSCQRARHRLQTEGSGIRVEHSSVFILELQESRGAAAQRRRDVWYCVLNGRQFDGPGITSQQQVCLWTHYIRMYVCVSANHPYSQPEGWITKGAAQRDRPNAYERRLWLPPNGHEWSRSTAAKPDVYDLGKGQTTTPGTPCPTPYE